MSTPDDVPDPLAGIDLRAWQPPAPPDGQVDAILARAADGTRIDVASAIDAPRTPRPSRARWLTVGALAAAAVAAVILVLVLWPRATPPAPAPAGPPTVAELEQKLHALEAERAALLDKLDGPAPAADIDALRDLIARRDAEIQALTEAVARLGGPPVPTPTPTPEPTPTPTPGSGSQAAATLAASRVRQCTLLREAENWSAVVTCGEGLAKADPGNRDARGIIERGMREGANQASLRSLEDAARKKDYPAVIAAMKKIEPDSVYFAEARRIHDRLRDGYTTEQIAWAKLRADRRDCRAIETRERQVPWRETAEAMRAVGCRGDGGGGGGEGGEGGSFGECDVEALIAQAKEAGGNAQYSRMLVRAEQANKCNPNKQARQLALMAACRLGNADKAEKYWPEFKDTSAMQQVCIDVMPRRAPPATTQDQCDAAALLEEARLAGQANNWSKVMTKAEASNRCQPSRLARQFALFAACALRNKDKALKYWSEFENNGAARQKCDGLVP